MSDYPHLTRAPITEAVIDMRVALPPGTSLADLEPFSDVVKDEYPEVAAIRAHEAQFDFNGATATTTFQEIGKIYWTADRSRAVQSRLSGFTFSQVKNYDSFDAMLKASTVLWEKYRVVARPTQVTRCALRFINRLAVEPGVDLNDVLVTNPTIADDLQASINEYFTKVAMAFGDNRHAVVTQLLPPPSATGGDALILDIDVFTDRMSIAPDSHEMWREFEVLRDLKNRCFFNSLNTKAVEGYL